MSLHIKFIQFLFFLTYACTLIKPIQSSFLDSFTESFSQGIWRDNNDDEFDDEVADLIERMILSGDINKFINHDKINNLFSSRRRLQTSETTVPVYDMSTTLPELRPCDELIFSFTSNEVTDIMKSYLAMVLSDDVPFQGLIQRWIERKWKFGVNAYKICASCEEFRDEYAGVGEDDPDAFNEYCAEDRYAANVKHSALLLIPVSDDGEFLPIKSNIAIWNRWVEFHATECPSEQFHNGTDWGEGFEELDARGYSITGFLTAGIGVMTLVPDYVGFCESYLIDGAPANKRAYQTGIVPIVLKTKNYFVEEISGGKMRLSNYVVSSGFSEGAMPAIVVSNALRVLGYRVRTQAGGGAVDHTSVNGLFSYYAKVLNEGLSLRFRSVLAGWAATYSSLNQNLPNTNQGQDFLSDEWKDTVIDWFRVTGYNYDEMEIANAIDNAVGDDFAQIFNPHIHAMIMEAHQTPGIQNTCDLAQKNKTDKFCEAVQMNDIKEDLWRAKHLTKLCWATGDELFSFRSNVPPFFTRLLNSNIRTIVIPQQLLNPGDSGVALNHQTAGGYCLVENALLFHRKLY